MRPEDGQCVDLLVGDEPILRAEKVRFEVAVGSLPRKARALSTPTRLLLYSRTPMGLQLTLVRFAEVDHVTAGRRKHDPYLQLLGDASRILLIFKSNKKRDAFRQFLESQLEHAQPVAKPRRIAVGA
ncbi:MAG: hypothetical protein OXM02_06450 [Bacteroidota bacterium]|nr:hypothetical protein [Bacteroidota bacterium]MDE2834145.1 hypothetical protein [Bacteroidota bacterium]MDE2956328.1 hypothetical protein [Bacteroidota bacterium]